METGAIVAVTLHGADEGDTATIPETVAEASERITPVVADTDNDQVAKRVSAEGPREVVTDKGYHSRAVCFQRTSNAGRSPAGGSDGTFVSFPRFIQGSLARRDPNETVGAYQEGFQSTAK